MKKAILGAVFAVAAISAMEAQAQGALHPVCAGAAVASSNTVGVEAPTVGAANSFIVSVFTARCSANVFLSGEDNITWYGVGSTSGKGRSGFRGSSMGGAVEVHSRCRVPTQCGAEDVTAALAGNHVNLPAT